MSKLRPDRKAIRQKEAAERLLRNVVTMCGRCLGKHARGWGGCRSKADGAVR